nr:MAG TPA: hypothetical protein [Caudoviricetes sp.]DAS47215.1 MAG TPA: hypothetical protein [Caudoviricetes sp.]
MSKGRLKTISDGLFPLILSGECLTFNVATSIIQLMD